MQAAELISKILSPLKLTDTGEEALTIMNIFHVKHLPVVHNDEYKGMLSEEEILNGKLDIAISQFKINGIMPFVYKSDHLFEVISKLGQFNLTTIAVIDEYEKYAGLITVEDLIQYYANSFSFKEPGSIIVLKTDRHSYSLAEISRIVESENAHILSSFLSKEENENNMLVTLKLSNHDIQPILASLERYDYVVKASYTEEEYIHGLKERYDALMKYLSV